MKFRKKEKAIVNRKIPTLKVGIRKKTILAFWVVLVISICFGVYKNFTAINMHTIHEKEIIEKQVIDTNSIESFVKNFAYTYHSWEKSQPALDSRQEQLKNYLTEELQVLNIDMIRADIPTSSKVNSVLIWNVVQIDTNNYQVTYSVNQQISEGDQSKEILSTFIVSVHLDNQSNMVITQNPTISATPKKSDYKQKSIEPDGSVDANTNIEINDFLTTFFKLYPTASGKELAYYVSNNTLKPIGKDYVFVELINPVYIKQDNLVKVIVSVKYLDQQTKATIVSQFSLTLEKSENWVIIK